MIKSSYGFAKTDKCPFFYFSDVVVGETTCDGKKKMYEYMSDFKDVFVMELPNTQSEMALQLWKSELIRFKKYLEKKFDVEITDEAVLEAVKEENKVRKAMKELYHVMTLDPEMCIRDSFKISDMNSQSHAEHGNDEKDRSIVCSPCKSITPEEGNDRKADNNHSDIFGKNRAEP